MKSFWSTTKGKVLVGLLALLLGFMIAAVYSGGSGSFFSSALSVVTAPIQKVSSSISSSVSVWFQKYTDAEALYNENQRLQKENQQLRYSLADAENRQHENDQFSRFAQTVEGRDDWTITSGAVIARDPLSRFYSFTINRGTHHGVSYLDPVMSVDGLVGYVSEVGFTYAKVITVLDVKLDVGAYSSKVREIGVVSGEADLAEEGLCQLAFLPRDTKITAGDLILTSGSLSGGTSIYPRDVLIGTVVRLEPDAHGTNPRAIIQPVADVSTITDVLVITGFAGQGTV